jgi:type IV secretory pathway VirJ component
VRFLALASVLLCAPLVAPVSSAAALQPQRFDGNPLGPIHYYAPQNRGIDGLVIMVSDRQGWDDNASALAEHLTAEGEVVVGLDLPVYRAALEKDPDSCAMINRDLEVIARDVEKTLPFQEYRPPVILGLGAGSGIVYGAIGQVLPNTFAGGIGLRFEPTIDVGHLLCLPLANGAEQQSGAGPVRYAPIAGHDTPFLFAPAETFAGPQLGDFLAAMPQARQIAGAAGDISAVDQALTQIPRIGKGETSVDGLPLVELSPAADQLGQHPLVIFYSGDGGWRDIDRTIGGYLAGQGYFVVGIDSLRYFWRKKTPEQMAADLDRLIRHYRPRAGGKGVILVGYSFGADVLPFMVNRMAPDTRTEVRLVSLLAMSDRASFEIRLEGILGARNSDGPPTLPELAMLKGVPILCVFGANEPESVCTNKSLDGIVSRAQLKGGHHFGGDYRDAADLIMAAERTRVSKMEGPVR